MRDIPGEAIFGNRLRAKDVMHGYRIFRHWSRLGSVTNLRFFKRVPSQSWNFRRTIASHVDSIRTLRKC